MTTFSCLRCGYDLSGLSADGVCPECACAVARSLESRRWLRAAEPEWLAGVARGLRLTRLSQVFVAAGLIFVIVAFVAMAITQYLLPPARLNQLMGVVGIGFVVVLGVGGVAWAGLSIAGAWLASAPAQSPFGLTARQRWSWRLATIAAASELFLQTAGLELWPGGPAWYPYARLAVGQAIVLWLLATLLRGLHTHERQTESMSAGLAVSHRNANKNLAGLILLLGLSWYLVYQGRPAKGLDLLWMFVALIVLAPTTGRVWRAVKAEQEAAKKPPAAGARGVACLPSWGHSGGAEQVEPPRE